MTTATPADALTRLERYLTPQPTRQGWLARRALDAVAADDEALAARLRERLARDVRPDGTVPGGLLGAAWLVQELLDLGARGEDVAPGRLAAWMLTRLGAPGAFGEDWESGDPLWRQFGGPLTGFFSPAPPVPVGRVAPVTLPNGRVFRAEAQARLVVSCVALRAVLRVGLGARTDVGLHVQGLRRIVANVRSWEPGYFAPDAMLTVLHALGATGPRHRDALIAATNWVVSQQLPDGTWPEADLFVALEALLAARTREGTAAIGRAVAALAARQRPDGTFGPVARDERALIALRSLLAVNGTVGSTPHRRAGEQ